MCIRDRVPTERALQLDCQVRAAAREIEGVITRDISPGQLQVFLEVVIRMSDNLDAP